MNEEMPFILWICETPKLTYEILAGLSNEGIHISYPTLMNRLGLLVAQRKLRVITRISDHKTIYQTIPQLPTETPKTPKSTKLQEDNKNVKH